MNRFLVLLLPVCLWGMCIDGKVSLRQFDVVIGNHHYTLEICTSPTLEESAVNFLQADIIFTKNAKPYGIFHTSLFAADIKVYEYNSAIVIETWTAHTKGARVIWHLRDTDGHLALSYYSQIPNNTNKEYVMIPYQEYQNIELQKLDISFFRQRNLACRDDKECTIHEIKDGL